MSALTMSLALLLAFVPDGTLAPDQPIREVTVFESGALVQRRAELPEGAGTLVFTGLPGNIDRAALRVRASGGAAVMGMEVRERRERRVPEARIEELRETERRLRRELAVLEDDLGLLDTLERHFTRLLEVPPPRPNQGAPEGDLASWARHGEAVLAESTRVRSERRTLARTIEEARERIAAVGAELGLAARRETVDLCDVVVDLQRTTPAGSVLVDLEYVVPQAGWKPRYDLRTAPDVRSVELSYRADVWQQSGEDWSGVELALSTARPRLGAEGPEPQAIWLHPLIRDRQDQREAPRASASRSLSAGWLAANDSLDAAEAVVESSGLSLRYRIASRESVPSRPEPSVVLVGSARIDVAPEYVCAPELDSNVWLRGRAINTTEWTLLPGRAATYFGADFLGYAALATVQPGAELVLHLGPDPAFTLERVTLGDETEGPGIFSKRASRTQSFRVKLANNGAAVARADGVAEVLVREAIARSTDERIKVGLDGASLKPVEDPRARKEREEDGVVTWRVDVPRGGEARLEWRIVTSYPDGAQLIETPRR